MVTSGNRVWASTAQRPPFLSQVEECPADLRRYCDAHAAFQAVQPLLKCVCTAQC